MLCIGCYWFNKEDATVCEHCGQPLLAQGTVHVQDAERVDSPADVPQAGIQRCWRCNAAFPCAATACPSCGFSASTPPSVPSFAPTGLAQASPTYAGFGRRLAAFVIDVVIVRVIIGVLAVAEGFSLGLLLALTGTSLDTVLPTLTVVMPVQALIVGWLYFAFCESSRRQATPGKILLGLHVADEDGVRLSFVEATIRYWSKLLSCLFLGAGFLAAAWTERRQALHDKIASTLVLKTARRAMTTSPTGYQ